ncbi:unnamed protein product [Durusdinium trenchii]|uniref:Uncharacterized protein n=1 Tax=Durusdinium trenchii TaxID=1381693 RepID=A0ABP0QFX1_9DINO
MNPRVMLDAVAKAGANHLLEGDDFDWLEFWEAANSEPWGRSHVVQSWPAEKRKRAIGIAAHGDEGQGKKDKSVLVLSWSSFGVHKRSTSCKFPFAVMRSTCFAYDGKRNLTLEMLQKHYVRMFNECAHMPDGDQLSLHYCAGKGDWKFKKEWLDEPRSYLRAAKKEGSDGPHMVCRRCLAGSDGSKPWLDVTNMAFHNQADMDAAARNCASHVIKHVCIGICLSFVKLK